MTTPTTHNRSPQGVPNNSARCLGSRSYEDGEWHWREGCDDCQRRIVRAGEGWIEPPPIIAFECEYRIGPDEIVAQGEHAPGPEPLSPAAKAVLDAALTTPCVLGDHTATRSRQIAAALRALAVRIKGADAIRQDILAIATELEGK